VQVLGSLEEARLLPRASGAAAVDLDLKGSNRLCTRVMHACRLGAKGWRYAKEARVLGLQSRPPDVGESNWAPRLGAQQSLILQGSGYGLRSLHVYYSKQGHDPACASDSWSSKA
jgi:hypothetical protein